MNDDDDKTVVLGASAPPPPPAASPTVVFGAAPNNALALGTRLGEFELVSLIGEGGFGIVYLAHDHSLGRKVALKEYMPASLASRGHDASVIVRSERHRDTFETGRRSFVNEARLLAQYDHPALVKVYRFWEANGTAYMAMPFYEGRTLRDELRQRGTAPDEAWIKKILLPVMDALELIHHDNCFHRDIAPDNIMLLRDDRPVLLDFGAARRVISDMTQALTVILKPGYAPIEQYAEMPGMKQGAWTDVYALAAVVYSMITGKTPPPAVSRMIEDAYSPLIVEAAGRYSESFLRGVDKALSVRPEDRPQTIADFRALLGVEGVYSNYTSGGSTRVQTAPAAPAATAAQPQTAPRTATRAPGSKSSPLTAIIVGVVLLTGTAAAGFLAWNMLPFFGHKGSSDTLSQFDTHTGESTPVGSASPPQPDNSAAVPQPPAPKVGTLSEAVQLVASSADPGINVALEAPPSVEIGSGMLKLSLRSSNGGLLYLFLWDKATDKVYRLFPNDLDASETLSANETFSVPRTKLAVPWNFSAQAPAGDWQILALVSEHPRDFRQSVLHKEDTMLAASRAEIEARFAAGEGITALIGSPTCASGQTCTDRYGIGTATVTKTEASSQRPVVVEPELPQQREPRPTRDPRRPKQVADAPTPPPRRQQQQTPAQEEEPRPSKNQNNPERAEREYMKQLNKELDQLLKQ